MGKKQPACYAVWRGRAPGIYETWPETKAQTDGYPNNGFKGCGTYKEAEDLMRRYNNPGSSQPLVSYLPGETFPRTRSRPRSPETESDSTQPSRSPSPTFSPVRVSIAVTTINGRRYSSDTSEAQTGVENAHAKSPAAATTTRPARDNNPNRQPSAGKVGSRHGRQRQRQRQQHQQRTAQQQQNNHHDHDASDLDKALGQLSI